MSNHFALFHFDRARRRAALIDTGAQRVLMQFPPQNTTSHGLPRHPACPFSRELAGYLGWLKQRHLLLRLEELAVDAVIDGDSDAADECHGADEGYAVQLATLSFRIPSPSSTLWLDGGRAGFMLLDGLLYSSFYLDVEETGPSWNDTRTSATRPATHTPTTALHSSK